MRANRKLSGESWEFDGNTITVCIQMAWKRHGGRKVIIAPDGGDAWAHRWRRMLEEGRYRSAVEIADAEGVTRSFVNRLLRLTLLAPDIVEAIPEGRRPKGLLLKASTGQPANWPKPKVSSPACCGSPSRRCVSLRRSSRADGGRYHSGSIQQTKI